MAKPKTPRLTQPIGRPAPADLLTTRAIGLRRAHLAGHGIRDAPNWQLLKTSEQQQWLDRALEADHG